MPRLPEMVSTPRLELRVPRADDAADLNRATTESFTELNRWMPWAAEAPTLDDTRTFCEESRRQWRADEAYAVLMIPHDGGRVLGATGFPTVDWDVPRFEIGYWCSTAYTGRGYVSESVRALTKLAFKNLRAARVEIRMDDRNERSWRVAERLGFSLEGVLRRDARDNRGSLRDTRIYALNRLRSFS